MSVVERAIWKNSSNSISSCSPRATLKKTWQKRLGRGDDYINKPFNRKELQARINVGMRMLNLQMTLSKRVQELEESIQRERQLQGLLPICSYCKKIRDDNNYWSQVERYIENHADVAFSHSICPECYESVVKPEIAALKSSVKQSRSTDASK